MDDEIQRDELRGGARALAALADAAKRVRAAAESFDALEPAVPC